MSQMDLEGIKMNTKDKHCGLGFSLGVEHLPTNYKVLCSIPWHMKKNSAWSPWLLALPVFCVCVCTLKETES